MNIARIGLLAVALLAAGGAAFLMRSMTRKEAAKEKPAIVAVAAAEVLVAARALEPGTVLTPADMRWQKWPEDAVSQTYFTAKGVPKAADEAAGAIVRIHVEPGEPMTRAKFVKAKDAGFMAAMLAPGMRAMSIRIDEDTSAGGFILPGDQVDVLLTHKVEEQGANGAYTAETILEKVRVLAVGQTFEQSSDKTVVAKTATIEVTPHQAELLSAAQATGNLSLALRSAAAGDLTASVGQPSKSRTNTIRIVRYARAGRATPALGNSGGDN
ncbi:MAG: Flp pilus assembly protein CpaB [Alphaproteobacteria bacterium]